MNLSPRSLLRIDRLLQPASWLSSGFQSSRSNPHPVPGPVVVIKLMGMGSIIRLISVCQQRQVDFSQVTLLTFEANREACEVLGLRNCLFIRTGSLLHFVGDCLMVRRTVKKLRPAWIVDFERCSNAVTLFRHWLVRACGAGSLSFRPAQPVRTPRHRVLDIRDISFQQMLLAGIELMPAGDAPVPSHPTTKCDPRKIIININCSDYLLARRYPRKQFGEVVRTLAQRAPERTFFLTGSPAEYDYVEQLRVRLVKDGVVAYNVAGQWTLSRLHNELTNAGVFISCDSGPLHLAVHSGTPTVAIWGPTQGEHFGYFNSRSLINVSLRKPCSPCFSHPVSRPAVACSGRIDCLRDLRQDLVASAAERLLSAEPAVSRLSPSVVS